MTDPFHELGVDDVLDAIGEAGLTDGRYDATTYGRSFADVYDEWYPSDAATDAAVDRIHRLAGPGASVLELGTGTGRLALPLADRGLVVTGMDSSTEMLDRLRDKDPDHRVRTVTGDVAVDPWPIGPYDVVVATNNLLLNLTVASDQSSCIGRAARALAPGGHLVIEAILPAPIDVRERRVDLKEVGPAGVILIVTDSDPDTGMVTAAHIELREGEPVRLRPWRIRPVTLAELDRWARDASLVLEERAEDWIGSAVTTDSTSAVSIYRR